MNEKEPKMAHKMTWPKICGGEALFAKKKHSLPGTLCKRWQSESQRQLLQGLFQPCHKDKYSLRLRTVL